MLAAWLASDGRAGRLVDGLRNGRSSTTEHTMIVTTGFWLAPLLPERAVVQPGHLLLLAGRALLRDGFDPRMVGPIENPNILLDNVSQVWTTTTAPLWSGVHPGGEVRHP